MSGFFSRAAAIASCSVQRTTLSASTPVSRLGIACGGAGGGTVDDGFCCCCSGGLLVSAVCAAAGIVVAHVRINIATVLAMFFFQFIFMIFNSGVSPHFY